MHIFIIVKCFRSHAIGHVTEYARAKTVEYPRKIQQISKPRVLRKKYLKDNTYNSLHLAQKYARIFVLGHYLFLKAHSFPRVLSTFSENCLPLGTDTVGGQISEHISALKGDYCLSKSMS